MLHTILVPLDGSAFAENALPVARAIADRAGATTILTHVHVPVLSQVVDPWLLGGVPVMDTMADAEQHDRAKDYLALRSAELAADNIEASCTLLGGPVVPTLVEHTRASAADLVVMTTHGHGVFSRVWLGSVADAFVRQSPVPTILLRPQHAEAASWTDAEPLFDVRRVLLTLDGSALAEQILEPATALAQTMGAALLILRVVEPPPILGYTTVESAARQDQAMRAGLSEAQSYLDGVAARLREHALTVETKVELAHGAAQTILKIARQEGCGLVALATHGRGGLARLLIGSVADKVVRGAEVPVLLLRPQPNGSGSPAGS